MPKTLIENNISPVYEDPVDTFIDALWLFPCLWRSGEITIRNQAYDSIHKMMSRIIKIELSDIKSKVAEIISLYMDYMKYSEIDCNYSAEDHFNKLNFLAPCLNINMYKLPPDFNIEEHRNKMKNLFYNFPPTKDGLAMVQIRSIKSTAEKQIFCIKPKPKLKTLYNSDPSTIECQDWSDQVEILSTVSEAANTPDNSQDDLTKFSLSVVKRLNQMPAETSAICNKLIFKAVLLGKEQKLTSGSKIAGCTIEL